MNSTDKGNSTKVKEDKKFIGVSRDYNFCEGCNKKTNTYVFLKDGKKLFECVCCGGKKEEPGHVHDICHRHQ